MSSIIKIEEIRGASMLVKLDGTMAVAYVT